MGIGVVDPILPVIAERGVWWHALSVKAPFMVAMALAAFLFLAWRKGEPSETKAA
ncbi:hypothetical protein [Geobacillus sp. C56-T2]|uniref:hypothetical protein n=1 Tax=Geobacillus sp. C56-T2 TaxID=600773 RepID=UPI001647D727|nr:hypothetical protein [Geobacillus sp. C56-T2]